MDGLLWSRFQNAGQEVHLPDLLQHAPLCLSNTRRPLTLRRYRPIADDVITTTEATIAYVVLTLHSHWRYVLFYALIC